MEEKQINCEERFLKNQWVFWIRENCNNNWTIESYRKLITIDSIEKAVSFYDLLNDKILNHYMIFIMKSGITPLWEDPLNINGGCFSIKISNKNITEIWKTLSYYLYSETIFHNNLSTIVNGITLSPKKNFFIIKIWLNTSEYTNPKIITNIKNIPKEGCFFKKHQIEHL